MSDKLLSHRIWLGDSRPLLRCWWVVAFVLISLVAYEQGARKVRDEYQHLDAILIQLQNEKTQALARKQELLLQINSQSDSQWIELVLMKGLGLVPEGQTKVYFPRSSKEAP